MHAQVQARVDCEASRKRTPGGQPCSTSRCRSLRCRHACRGAPALELLGRHLARSQRDRPVPCPEFGKECARNCMLHNAKLRNGMLHCGCGRGQNHVNIKPIEPICMFESETSRDQLVKLRRQPRALSVRRAPLTRQHKNGSYLARMDALELCAGSNDVCLRHSRKITTSRNTASATAGSLTMKSENASARLAKHQSDRVLRRKCTGCAPNCTRRSASKKRQR